MIQRLQSVYLLLAGIIATLLLFIPLARFNVSGQGYFSLFSLGIDSINVAPIGGTISYLWIIALCTVLVAICSFCSIFLFKHRMLQLKLTRWAIAFEVTYCLTYALQCYNFQSNTTSHFAFTLGTALPSGIFIFLWLAARAIKKDEELVRAANRIR